LWIVVVDCGLVSDPPIHNPQSANPPINPQSQSAIVNRNRQSSIDRQSKFPIHKQHSVDPQSAIPGPQSDDAVS